MKYLVSSIKYQEKLRAQRAAWSSLATRYWLLDTGSPGFTLLLASLISSILLSIAIFMITIAQKEVVLASVGRDSQYAFYAADSGSECALYWDFRGAFDPTTPTRDVQCSMQRVGENIANISADQNDLITGGQGLGVPSRLEFEQNGRCVKVTVLKEDVGGGDIRTSIDSRGYNLPCSVTNSPRKLERAVRLTY
jgi:hypothetical protein